MCERVKANRKADIAAANEIMRRNYDAPLVDDLATGCLKFITGPASLSAAARKSDYKNRFILTGARDPTKTRAGP